MAERKERTGCMQPKNLNIEKFTAWENYAAEPKVDGVRTKLFVRNGKATSLSSTDEGQDNTRYVLEYLETAAKKDSRLNNRFYDGEFILIDTGLSNSLAQNKVSGLLNTIEEQPEAKNLRVRFWDSLPIKEYDNKVCYLGYKDRKIVVSNIDKTFRQMFSDYDDPIIQALPYYLLKNKKEFLDIYNKYLEMGYEGTVLKKLDGLYNYTKSGDWLKYKPYFEGDFTIIGAIEGQGKYIGMLGKINVEGWLQPDGNISAVSVTPEDIKIKANPGSGFSDLQRQEYWNDWLAGKLTGRVVEVEHEGITANNSLKFAIFSRMRPDKD